MGERIADKLRELFSRGEEEINLADAAATLAHVIYPDLDFRPYHQRLDDYARAVARMPMRGDEPEARVSNLNAFLFESLGFVGNAEDYHDPRNSFLNDVLDRRTGIPISLSVIYMEIARRLELPIYGVGLPSHFVVKYEAGRRRFFIDPFHDGRMLNRQGCRRLLRQIHGRQVELTDLHFAAVNKRQIILRMATNLRDIYLSTRQFGVGVHYLDAMMALGDTDPETLRMRAWAYGESGRRADSVADMEAYLEQRPQSLEAEETREMMMQLKRNLALMN